ncbi:MAG: sensor histidine kinase [Geobacter sp.]
MLNRATERDSLLSAFVEQHSKLVVLDLDSAGVVSRANAYAQQLLGVQCVGRRFAELLVTFQADISLEKLWSGSDDAALLSFSCVSGLPETLNVRALVTASGHLLIGEHLLDELQQLRSSLMEMNHELSNLSRQQQKSNAELQRLNELKNQFLGMAAHDLRNPIANIYAYTSLFLDDEERQLAPDMRQALTDLRSLSEFMLSLISNLLDITVIEMGQLRLDKQPLAPEAFLHQVVGLNRLFAQRNGITLQEQFTQLPEQLLADPHKLKQVLNNLISNGIKFSPSGSTVLIKADAAGSSLRVSVVDHGPGISEYEQQKLFQPFGRGNARPEHGQTSTGLGLAISRRIVEAHGGNIWVISEPGKGATFCFELPL